MKNRNRTIVIDFADESQYENIISDCTVFIEFVIAYILSIGFQILHNKYCTEGNCFTRHSHYIRVKSGGITIWRMQCKTCKAVFTIMPSFLIRYMRYRTEQVREALIAYHGGLSFENCAICFNIAPLALYRFICALGKYSLEHILTTAGVPLPKHVQVDEKHTKCLEQKGYIPIVSSGHAIWHIDYIDSVGEEILEGSYEQFAVETKKIETFYAPATVTHDGFKATRNALSHIFKKASTYLICWLHACWGIARILESFSKEEANRLSFWLLHTLKECHEKTSLQRISLRSHFTALLRHYKPILPIDVYKSLKDWIERNKPYFYASMDFSLLHCFSYSIDHICNHLDRKLFMMKHFHHPEARKDLFLKGFALIHDLIPYQRFARNAYLSPAQVEGAQLPHPDWLISLLILTSGGYHKM